jgi:ketosteroid isomerase-like protein
LYPLVIAITLPIPRAGNCHYQWGDEKETTVDNVEIVKRAYEAFGRGDLPAILAAFDPQIEWREAEGNPFKPDGKPWIGADAIVQNLFLRLVTEWDGFTITPHTFHGAGDTVIVEARYTGTCKATGKSLDAQVCHLWKLRDGVATHYQQYVDTAQFQRVAGTAEAA